MPDLYFMTFATSILSLIFSPSPFAILIYSMMAIHSTSLEEWIKYTAVMLLTQIGYAVYKAMK